MLLYIPLLAVLLYFLRVQVWEEESVVGQVRSGRSCLRDFNRSAAHPA